MRHFKLPLIVTAITFVVAIIAGIAIVTVIHRAKIPDSQKKARAEKLGGGVGGRRVAHHHAVLADRRVEVRQGTPRCPRR